MLRISARLSLFYWLAKNVPYNVYKGQKVLENYKKNQEKELKKIEKNLNKEKKELDSSKIILSEEEFDKKLVNYQENVRKYQEKIDFINNEIYNKFESGKLVIRKEVIKILQDIAIEKNLDIILYFDI